MNSLNLLVLHKAFWNGSFVKKWQGGVINTVVMRESNEVSE